MKPRDVARIDWAARFKVLEAQARNPLLKGFYAAGAVAAQTPLEHVPLLALDVETTGLDTQKDAIVSIGLMPFTLQRIRCADARYWVVKPRTELSDESVTFHHITHSDIRHAPALPHVLNALLGAMAGHVMVVHYRTLERGFLDSAVRRHLGEGLEFPVIDTMQLEALLHRGKRGWVERLLRRPPASIRLADSRARYHLPPYHAHHALTDALATAELLQAQVAHRFEAGMEIGRLWD